MSSWFPGGWPAALLGLSLGLTVAAAQPPIAPRPIYTQCRTLKADGKDGDGVSQALRELNEGKEEKGRLAAIRTLGQSCDQRAVEPLIDLLGAPSIPVRVAAVEALGQLGSLDSLDPLFARVFDPSVEVRLALISSLASFQRQSARNMVLTGLAHPGEKEITQEEEMRLRGIAILTLNQLNDTTFSRKAITILQVLQNTKYPALQAIVEQTLAALPGTRHGTREMISILKTHSAPIMRIWAIQWLGKMRLAEGRDALAEAAANDRDQHVREEAAAALKLLGN